MKRLTTGILGLSLSLLTVTAFAAPYHYTFSGNVQYIELDGAFLSYIDIDGDPATTSDNFQSGETIEYTFLVDFDLPGFCAGPLGTSYSSTCTSVNIADSATANYFFTDLVSATKLAPPTEEGTTFNYGLSISNLGMLLADSAVFVVSPYDIPVEDWVATDATTPGTTLSGTDAWAAPNGNSPYGRIYSTLTLASITPVVTNAPDGECIKRPKHHHDMDDRHHDDGHSDRNNSHDDENEDEHHHYKDRNNSSDEDRDDHEKEEHHNKYSKSNHKHDCMKDEHDDDDSSIDGEEHSHDDDRYNKYQDKHRSNRDNNDEIHRHHDS